MNLASLELWRKRIDDKKASSLNTSDWCDKNNLTKHAYYYWKKRVEIADQDGMDTHPKIVFAELKPSPKPVGETTTNLQICWNDLKISISNADTARLAAEFIIQLQKLC